MPILSVSTMLSASRLSNTSFTDWETAQGARTRWQGRKWKVSLIAAGKGRRNLKRTNALLLRRELLELFKVVELFL